MSLRLSGLALAGLALLTACSDSPSKSTASTQGPPPVLDFATLLARGSAVPRPSAALPEGATIESVDSGRADLHMLLAVADRTRLEERPGFHYTWPLPFPPARVKKSDRVWPKITLPGLDEADLDIDPATAEKLRRTTKAPTTVHAWIDGTTLHIAMPRPAPVDGQLDFSYPVDTARLVGGRDSSLGLETLVRVRHAFEYGTKESLTFEAGTTLLLPLDDFPGATLSATLTQDSDAPGARIGFARDDAALEWHAAGPGPLPLHLELPAGPGQLRVVVEGAPGTLVRLDEPRLDFSDTLPELAERPNILFILLDTLRADRMATFGGSGDLTPRLDELAGESLAFDQCWSTSCWTLPAISSMMTGVFAEVHGGIAPNTRINPALDTLAETFQQAGYYTEAVTEGGLFRSGFGLDQGFVRFFEQSKNIDQGVGLAQKFFEKRSSPAPWFFTLHSYQVHEPYTPSRKLMKQLTAGLDDDIKKRISRPSDFIDLFESHEMTPELTQKVAGIMEQLYDAEVRTADAAIGRFLDGLKAAGQLDNAIVVFTADHGEEFGEHGLLGHSDTLYPELVHVPLLLRFPDGYRAGELVPQPVSQINLLPTILDAAGLGMTADTQAYAGTSLLRELPTDPIYTWRYSPDGKSIYSLRLGDEIFVEGAYKWPRTESGPELYDLADDPGAHHNLAGDRSGHVESLKKLLESVRKRYSDGSYDGTQLKMDESTRAELEALGYL